MFEYLEQLDMGQMYISDPDKPDATLGAGQPIIIDAAANGRTAMDEAYAMFCENVLAHYGLDLPHWKPRTAAALIEDLTATVKRMLEDEQCDHSVGICWCSEFELLRLVEDWQRSQPVRIEPLVLSDNDRLFLQVQRDIEQELLRGGYRRPTPREDADVVVWPGFGAQRNMSEELRGDAEAAGLDNGGMRRLLAAVFDGGTPESASVVHACPPDGEALTPCCGRTPFELPTQDRIAEAPYEAVTCNADRMVRLADEISTLAESTDDAP